jgi:deoxyribonuclease-4
MRIGAHVSAAGGIERALGRGADIGAEVVQIFTQSPRMWRLTEYAPEVLASYRGAAAAAAAAGDVAATYCHATYLINLASDDAELTERSVSALSFNLAVGSGIGADGVVLHLGSHRGQGFAAAMDQIATCLLEALGRAEAITEQLGDGSLRATCPILLENAAGAGGTVGRSLDELAAVLEHAGSEPRLGVCLDTQHLFASGTDYRSAELAEAVVRTVDSTIGLTSLRCLHLNDSKVPLGANRDRHENLGDGAIGATGLAVLLGHPALQQLDAILEVPGQDGKGPGASDVAMAKQLHREGLALWAGRPGARSTSKS